MKERLVTCNEEDTDGTYKHATAVHVPGMQAPSEEIYGKSTQET